MFELMESEDKPNIKVRAFGVGTVGCRLLSNAKFKIDESIELVYIHAESDFLESLGSHENFKIILRDACHRVNNLSDANRAIEDAADGNETAEQSWEDFHEFIGLAIYLNRL